MKKLLLIILAVFASQLLAIAQISYEKRLEIDLRNGYSGETIYESSKGYFILESTADDKIDGQTQVKYDLYSGDLELQQTETILVPKGMRFDEMFYNDDYVFNIYSNKQREFLIIGVCIKDLSISKTNGKMPAKAFLTEMKVLGDYAYFMARIKAAGFVYKVDLATGKGTSFPISIGSYSPKKLHSENYQLLEKTQEILSFTRATVKKNVTELYLSCISADETIQKPVKISGVGDNSIVSVSGCRVNNEKIIITGTYAKKGLMSEGLFFGEIEDNAINYIHYYNFLDLKDFLSYLPERRQEKIEKKKAKKEARGKEMLLDYWIADHDVIVLDDGYLFLGEAYFPTYRTETRTSVGANGTTTTYTVTVFDGYQYTHATLGKFSKDGELMWDVCFALNPGYKPMIVRKFIAISEQTATQISMVYTSGNEIVSKSIDFDGNIVSDEQWEIIDTGNDADKTKRTFSNVDYWYGNYFLAYGSQVIKTGKEKRKVYFVNKIGF